MVVNHFCNGHLALPPEKQIRSKMVYLDSMGHVPSRCVLFSRRTREKATCDAFNQFLDLVCYGKGKPKGGDVIKVK